MKNKSQTMSAGVSINVANSRPQDKAGAYQRFVTVCKVIGTAWRLSKSWLIVPKSLSIYGACVVKAASHMASIPASSVIYSATHVK